LSAALVAALVFGLKYSIARRPYDVAAFYWFAGGNLVYYGAAVALAFALKDNRAFCKYLCPIVAFLKPAAVPSLLKVGSDAEKCDSCGACDKVCPMDVKVAAYAEAGRRVLASECIQCLTCVSACGKGALKATVALDAGGADLLRYRERR
jgi:polyferredoxin